jgi:hypothetical protein
VDVLLPTGKGRHLAQGDETGIQAWVEHRIGFEPDSVLRVRLSAKELGEAAPEPITTRSSL